MASGIVYQLEIIEIENHETTGLACSPRSCHLHLELHSEETLVKEAGQIIRQKEGPQMVVFLFHGDQLANIGFFDTDNERGVSIQDLAVFFIQVVRQSYKHLRILVFP